MKQKRLNAHILKKMIPAEDSGEVTPRTLGQRRKELLALFGLSAGLDIALFAAEIPLDVSLFGLPLLVDEIVELGISYLIGRNRLKVKWYDRVIGLLPIPGVTAITVRAGWELLHSFARPARFMASELQAIEE